MPPNPKKKYPTIAACGLDCGLCPRYHTAGSSRCPGCGGPNFVAKHPPCGILSCCVLKHDIEVCSLCGEYPCSRIQKNLETTRDSFNTYQKVGENQRLIQDQGLEHFLVLQQQKIAWLEQVLQLYDDGGSKGKFCIAATLLPLPALQEALANSNQKANEAKVTPKDRKAYAQILLSELNILSNKLKIVLKLRK